MANRYWVGGAGTWDTSTTHWSATSGGAAGASAPTSADSVFFDQNATYTVTASTAIACADFNYTSGNVTFSGASAVLSVDGSLVFQAGNIFSFGTLIFTSSLTGKTINTRSTTVTSDVIFNGTGAWTLSNPLVCNTITLTSGSLTTANNALNALSLTSIGSSTRSLILGTSTVTLTGSGITVLNFNSSLSLTASSATFAISGSNVTFNGASFSYGTVNFSSSANPNISSITGANSFTSLTITAPNNAEVTKFSFGGNQTIGTFVCAGSSYIKRIELSSATIGTAITLAVTTYLTKQYLDFRDITASGGTPWIGTSMGNCGGNSNITFDAPKTVYSVGGGANLWGSTSWGLTSGGAQLLANFPLAQDTAIIDNNSTTSTITINGSYNIGTLNMSAATNARTFNAGTSPIAPNIYGNLTIGTGITWASSTSTLTFLGRSTQTITSNNVVIGCFFAFQSIGSTVQLAGNLFSNRSVTLTAGNFDAVSYDVLIDSFNSANSNTRTLSMGSGTWTLTGSGTPWNITSSGLTFNKGSANIVLSLTSGSAAIFAGASLTYNKLTFAGPSVSGVFTITGSNTFSELSSTKTNAFTVTFTSSTTTTVSAWTISGSLGNLVTINSSGAANSSLVYSGASIVSANYLAITKSTATPNLTWYAGTTSVDNGSNSGWIFANPNTGNMFMMFI